MHWKSSLLGLASVLFATLAYGQVPDIDDSVDKLRAFQRKLNTREIVKSITVQVPVVEQRVQQFAVLVPVTEVFWVRRGFRTFQCQRTVFRQEIRQRTVSVTRMVNQTRNQTSIIQDIEPEIDSEFTSKFTTIAELGSLPTVAEATFDQMNSIFLTSTTPLFEQADRVEESGEILNVRSQFHPTDDNTAPHRFYVLATPVGNNVVITVFGYRLAQNTNLPNVTESDFVKADDQLSTYLAEKADELKTKFEAKR